MARKSRELSGTGIYHVMMRGTNRQDIFEDGDDYLRFLGILRNMVYPVNDAGKPLPQRCHFYTYCLMTNHVHLLVREAEDKLAPAIHRIATAYAHYYNLTACLSLCYESKILKLIWHFAHLFVSLQRNEARKCQTTAVS